MKSRKDLKQTEIGMIPKDWSVKTIDQIKSTAKSAISTGPFGSTIKKEFFVDNGVPIIKGNNLTSYRFLDEDFAYLTEEKANELRSANCHPGDIVITYVGTLGQVGIIPRKPRYKRYIISQSGLKLSCDESQVISEYVFYFLKSSTGQHLLLQNASQTGVPIIAQPSTSLKNIHLPVPNIDEQRRIVGMLENFNDKIDLLQDQNKTLETLSQTIFKHWFIDFEFPNEKGLPYKSSGGNMIKSELGIIPNKWSVKRIEEVTETIFSGGTPDTRNDEYWNGDYPWLSSGETSNHFIIKTEKTITKKGIDNSSTRMTKIGDIVIASAGQGKTRGQTSLCLLDTYMNQSIIALRSKDSVVHNSYLFLNLSMRYPELRSISDSHSIRGSLTSKIFRDLKIIVPPLKYTDVFHSWFGSTVKRIHANLIEIEILTQIRDSLLPKLMSGMIRIPSGVK